MPVNDELGKRMKEYYEKIPQTKLMRRTPVVLRLDGRSFHSYTKGFDKPFDEVLVKTMQDTMKYLCENIQGCVLGYTQSDEITLVLTDYKKLTSQAWFDYEVQKLCSISASMATMAFNKYFKENYKNWRLENILYLDMYIGDEILYLDKMYKTALEKGAMFDSRCFNIPKEEVTNLIYWRQLDAIRNSIQMVGQANFSSKQLHKRNCNNILEMLSEKGINWIDYPTHLQRGSCCKKIKIDDRHGWAIDLNIPKFVNEGREYIENILRVAEGE